VLARILVVDDDVLNREIIEAMLSISQYEVIVASSGEIALEMLQVHSFDLVITDIRMNDMSGFDLCREIRTHEKTSTLPIMIVSGFNEHKDIEMGKQAGANLFLSRPLDFKDFINSVKALVKR
jgi:DNA-binding response OmpR family regulator